jgi:hypothetical protein
MASKKAAGSRSGAGFIPQRVSCTWTRQNPGQATRLPRSYDNNNNYVKRKEEEIRSGGSGNGIV